MSAWHKRDKGNIKEDSEQLKQRLLAAAAQLDAFVAALHTELNKTNADQTVMELKESEPDRDEGASRNGR